LAPEAESAAAFAFLAHVERAYAGLLETAAANAETGLGGKLFYAGELDAEGRALVVAANIAGAASLAAIADRDIQKQAVRDGIADFLVTSLDEALRILKNQLRKREAVAVCVALAPEAVECEMRDRGVLPDLQRRDVERRQSGTIRNADRAVLQWTVASAQAQWLPKLDAIAMECLNENAWRERRWLRLAPRYLGRLAQRIRLMRCDDPSATRFVQQVQQLVARREIAVAVEMKVRDAAGQEEEWRMRPPEEMSIQ